MKKLKELFWAQLRQGVTPEGLALTIGVGATISIFPIFGATTTLCLIAGHVLKLNQGILQTINYLMTAVHLLAIPIFIYAGETLFGAEHVTINPVKIIEQFSAHPMEVLRQYGWAGLEGVAAWAIVAPVLIFLGYRISLPLFRRLKLKVSVAEDTKKS